MINANVSGQVIVITVDKKKSKVTVAADTAELVIDVGSSGQPVSQHTKQMQWRSLNKALEKYLALRAKTLKADVMCSRNI